VLQGVAVCCSVLQCVAVCCSVLQCAAVCCSVLQCVAVCCSVLQLSRIAMIHVNLNASSMSLSMRYFNMDPHSGHFQWHVSTWRPHSKISKTNLNVNASFMSRISFRWHMWLTRSNLYHTFEYKQMIQTFNMTRSRISMTFKCVILHIWMTHVYHIFERLVRVTYSNDSFVSWIITCMNQKSPITETMFCKRDLQV